MLLRSLTFAAVVACLLGPAMAQDALPSAGEGLVPFGSKPGMKEELRVSLLADVDAVRPGEPFTLALKFEHDEHWHSYWINSGGVETPPAVKWTLPEGFSAGPLQFGTPQLIDVEATKMKVWAFEGVVYHLTEITPPAALEPGKMVEVKAGINAQYCLESCKFLQKSLALSLPVAADARPNAANAALLAEYRKKNFPLPSPADWKVGASQSRKAITLTITGSNLPTADPVYLFTQEQIIDSQAPQKAERKDGALVLTLGKNADYEGNGQVLPGILAFGKGEARASYQLPSGILTASSSGSVLPTEGLGATLLFALLGGLILNLMPCVFPVIGIKIMGFVRQAGQDRKKIAMHGIIFSLGVLISFWVLSGIVFWLRSRGEQIGWGFQLQNPVVVYVLLLIMFVFALNMYGVFEVGGTLVGTGQNLVSQKGYAGTFFSGVLAVVVATPCSAPFLASALGATISLSAIPFFAVFTTIAIGLALPYLLLSCYPALIKQLPKPGPWMESFKQIMSLLLFATAGYLVWVLGGLFEKDATVQLYTIVGLSVLALAFYIYGRWSTPIQASRTRWISGLLALALTIFGVWLGFPKKDALSWEPWSKDRLAELLDEGKPVYIDFTARWCATCQTNKVAYKSQEIEAAAKKKGIVLLKADWTDKNETIAKALAEYGKSAIPVNVLYLPGVEEPEILPTILTTNAILEAWNKLPDAK